MPLVDKQAHMLIKSMTNSVIWAGEKEPVPVTFALDCEAGLTSRYVPLFRQAGVFDMEEWCAGVAKAVDEAPGLREELRELKAKNSSLFVTRPGRLKRDDEIADLARAVQSRAATPDELRLMAELTAPEYEKALNCFLFFAATTHAPGSERPDWSLARLMNFAAMRADPEPGSALVREKALNIVKYYGMLDAPSTRDLIRRAHQGDMQAMRAMAVNYETGAMGFFKDSSMRSTWLSLGRSIGDAPTLLFLAASAYDNSDSWVCVRAWTFAYLAHERGNDKEKELAATLMRLCEARMGLESVPPWLREEAEAASNSMTISKKTMEFLRTRRIQ